MVFFNSDNEYVYISEDNKIKVYDKVTMSLIKEVPVFNSKAVI